MSVSEYKEERIAAQLAAMDESPFGILGAVTSPGLHNLGDPGRGCLALSNGWFRVLLKSLSEAFFGDFDKEAPRLLWWGLKPGTMELAYKGASPWAEGAYIEVQGYTHWQEYKVGPTRQEELPRRPAGVWTFTRLTPTSMRGPARPDPRHSDYRPVKPVPPPVRVDAEYEAFVRSRLECKQAARDFYLRRWMENEPLLGRLGKPPAPMTAPEERVGTVTAFSLTPEEGLALRAKLDESKPVDWHGVTREEFERALAAGAHWVPGATHCIEAEVHLTENIRLDLAPNGLDIEIRDRFGCLRECGSMRHGRQPDQREYLHAAIALARKSPWPDIAEALIAQATAEAECGPRVDIGPECLERRGPLTPWCGHGESEP